MASLPVSWLSSFPNLERLVCDYLKLEINPQVGLVAKGGEEWGRVFSKAFLKERDLQDPIVHFFKGNIEKQIDAYIYITTNTSNITLP